MAHQAQDMWCEFVKSGFPTAFKGRKVLDVGSLDINGNNRKYFTDCEYYGIDVGAGRNVDFVCPCHKFKPRDFGLSFDQFDTVISTECFEHDCTYGKSLQNIYQLLKSGGLFTFTCATTGRHEHGTARTSPSDAPFTNDYYKNLTASDICAALDIPALFSSFCFSTLGTDLRFWGIKSL